jgi:hypothetical protein
MLKLFQFFGVFSEVIFEIQTVFRNNEAVLTYTESELKKHNLLTTRRSRKHKGKKVNTSRATLD